MLGINTIYNTITKHFKHIVCHIFSTKQPKIYSDIRIPNNGQTLISSNFFKFQVIHTI